MREHETAVVYVVSPNRKDQLLQSLRSLLASGSRVDLIRICCVAAQPRRWRFADPRVSFEHVEPLFGEYFHGNKLYLCDTHAERVVFLDADTVVLRPLERIWERREESFLARRGTAMRSAKWDAAVWRGLLRTVGGQRVPMFNAGVLVFQNGSHRQLKNAWNQILLRFLVGELPPPVPDKRMLEQWALAMAVAQEGISYVELGRRAHAFAWQKESPDNAIVFHYGDRLFRRLRVPPPAGPGLAESLMRR